MRRRGRAFCSCLKCRFGPCQVKRTGTHHSLPHLDGNVVSLSVPESLGGGESNCFYWENTEGGHGGAADNKQRAYMWALSYNFLWKFLTITSSTGDGSNPDE
eukprot:5400667-Pleurochrysis_carterae.AAC.7